MKDLLTELYTAVPQKWEEIGILLGIEPGKLDAVKMAEHHNPNKCLCEMLKLWMRTTSSPHSWLSVVEALDSVGENALASSLKSKYC